MIDLDKLEALYRQATPGPWSWEAVGEKDNSWCLGVECEGEVVDWVAQSGSAENLADPALIVAMHGALPAIIAELRKARRDPYDYPGAVAPSP